MHEAEDIHHPYFGLVAADEADGRRGAAARRRAIYLRRYQMRRREVVGALLAFGSSTAHPQVPGRMYRLGVLGPGDASSWQASPARTITLAKLAEYGFSEGQNLQVEPKYGDGSALPALARELVEMQPDVIIAISRAAIFAARRATSTIPIVMSFIGEDPVVSGLAASISRPGGNVTGLVMRAPELDAKRLELLREAFPHVDRIAVLISDRDEGDEKKAAMSDIARRMKVELLFFPVGSPHEYRSAFDAMAGRGAQALAVASAPDLFRDASLLARLALETRLPTICEWREMAAAGCLLAYGANLVELRHRTADYVARIFRGVTPGDLPIEGPTRFDFAVNARTARALGLVVSPSVLLRADEVIE